MCFKNCLVSIVHIQVDLGSIFSCKLYEMGFSKFNERLLTLNHLFKCSNMIIISLIKSVWLQLVTIILVLSANRTRHGMDPCGMPCLILPHSEDI
jgi:hypothetical protein